MKKVWEAPELLAVVHGSPEEAVLLTCYDNATCEFQMADGADADTGIISALSVS